MSAPNPRRSMPYKIRVLLTLEMEVQNPELAEAELQLKLDTFRDSVQAFSEHGLTFTRAAWEDVQTALKFHQPSQIWPPPVIQQPSSDDDEFKPGAIVCYRSAFLKSIHWHTDVPKNGRVIRVVGEASPRK